MIDNSSGISDSIKDQLDDYIFKPKKKGHLFRNLFIGITIVVLLGIGILILSSFLPLALLGDKKTNEAPTQNVTENNKNAVETNTANFTVNLIPRSDKKAVILDISGLTKDILSIEYELTYTQKDNLPRGVLGKIQVRGEKEITRDDIVLGTCNSGKCVYDEGVRQINLVLTFNSISGSSNFTKTYSL